MASMVQDAVDAGELGKTTDISQLVFELRGITLAFHQEFHVMRSPTARDHAVRAVSVNPAPRVVDPYPRYFRVPDGSYLRDRPKPGRATSRHVLKRPLGEASPRPTLPPGSCTMLSKSRF
jgi:hypothetical protein